jgi:hypothetical protein
MKLNPNKATVKTLKKAIEKENGQCPCVPEVLRDEDTI